VALAVNLPSDGSIGGADVVVTSGASCRACVEGDISSHTHLGINNHTTDHVRVEVVFIIDNGKHLSMYSNSTGNVLLAECQESLHGKVAEDAIIEGSLVLVDRATRTSSRMGPVHLVGLADFHSHAVLPLVLHGELLIVGIVVVATESIADLLALRKSTRTSGPIGPLRVPMGTVAVLVVLADGVVFGAQVPVHVHRAHAAREVVLGVGLDVAHVDVPGVAQRDVGAGLGLDVEVRAQPVGQGQLRPGAHVGGGVIVEQGQVLALQEGAFLGVGVGVGAIGRLVATAPAQGIARVDLAGRGGDRGGCRLGDRLGRLVVSGVLRQDDGGDEEADGRQAEEPDETLQRRRVVLWIAAVRIGHGLQATGKREQGKPQGLGAGPKGRGSAARADQQKSCG